MTPKTLSQICLVFAGLALPGWAHAQSMLERKGGCTVAVEVTFEINFGEMVDMMETDEARESHVLRGTGVVVSPGLILVPRSIVELNIGSPSEEFQIDTKRASLVAVVSDGKIEGEVVRSFEDLGLTLVRLKGDSVARLQPVKLSSKSTVAVGQDLVAIGRLEPNLGNAACLAKGYVGAVDLPPASSFLVQGPVGKGSALFSEDGTFLGVATLVANEGHSWILGNSRSIPRVVAVTAAELSRRLEANNAPPEGIATASPALQGTEEASEEFVAIDEDKNGSLSQEEFISYASEKLGDAPPEFIAGFATRVDSNSDGKITPGEFEQRLEALQEGVGPGEADQGARGSDPSAGEEEPHAEGSSSESKDSAPSGWLSDFETAKRKAKKENKPLLAVFSASWCGPCQALKKKVYPKASVKDELSQWVVVYIDGDAQPKLLEKHSVNAFPTLLVLSAAGEELERKEGMRPTPEAFLGFLREAKSGSNADSEPKKSRDSKRGKRADLSVR